MNPTSVDVTGCVPPDAAARSLRGRAFESHQTFQGGSSSQVTLNGRCWRVDVLSPAGKLHEAILYNYHDNHPD